MVTRQVFQFWKWHPLAVISDGKGTTVYYLIIAEFPMKNQTTHSPDPSIREVTVAMEMRIMPKELSSNYRLP